MTDKISYEQFVNTLRSYINDSQDIIINLRSIRSFVGKAHTDANVVKSVGTTSGLAATIATAGLLFTPLTGGLSALASGVAIGGSIGSIGLSVLTTFAERADEKEAKKRIEYCQIVHEASVNRVRHETEKILEVINQLVEEGINFDVATISTLALLRDIGKSGYAIYGTWNAVVAIQEALTFGQIQKILAPTGITITKNLQGNLSVAFPSIQVVQQLNQAQLKTFGLLARGPGILLGKTASTMGKFVFIGQVFFSVVDVAFLIDSWTTDHPLIESINNFISQLEISIENTKNQLKVLEIFQMV